MQLFRRRHVRHAARTSSSVVVAAASAGLAVRRALAACTGSYVDISLHVMEMGSAIRATAVLPTPTIDPLARNETTEDTPTK